MIALRSFLLALQEFTYRFTVDNNDVTLSGNFIAFALLIVLIAWVKGREIDNRKKWQKAKDQVPPQFEHSNSPLILVGEGVMGLFKYRIYQTLFWTFIILAVDQFFTRGGMAILLVETLQFPIN